MLHLHPIRIRDSKCLESEPDLNYFNSDPQHWFCTVYSDTNLGISMMNNDRSHGPTCTYCHMYHAQSIMQENSFTSFFNYYKNGLKALFDKVSFLGLKWNQKKENTFCCVCKFIYLLFRKTVICLVKIIVLTSFSFAQIDEFRNRKKAKNRSSLSCITGWTLCCTISNMFISLFSFSFEEEKKSMLSACNGLLSQMNIYRGAWRVEYIGQ